MRVLSMCYAWECSIYNDKREGFMVKLRAILGEALKTLEH